MNGDDKVAFSWIEFILVLLFVLLAMGIFRLVNLGVRTAQADEPQKIMIRGTAEVPQGAADVTVAVGKMEGLQAALAAEKVAYSQGAISLTVAAGQYPTPDATPVEVRQTLEVEQAMVATRIPLLETEVAAAVAAVSSAELDLAERKQDEATTWQTFTTRQQFKVLTWAVGGTIFVLGLGALLVVWSGIHRRWEINGYEVVGATAGLVALLYGYAAFDWVGVAVAAVFVLIGIVIAAMRWRRGNRRGETRQ